MKRSAHTLALRQQRLLLRSAELRRQIAQDAQAWQAPLALADRVHAGWRWLRAHPEVALTAGAVLVVLRPRRAWRLGWRLYAGWRLWRRVQGRLQPLGVNLGLNLGPALARGLGRWL